MGQRRSDRTDRTDVTDMTDDSSSICPAGQRRSARTEGTFIHSVLCCSAQWFQQLLAKFDFKNKFPPSKLRHIFVDERCSTDSVAGPSNKAAARLMGNSVGTLAAFQM